MKLRDTLTEGKMSGLMNKVKSIFKDKKYYRIENRKTQDGIELIITMNMDGGDYQFRFVFNEDIDGVYYQDDDGAYASDLINKTAPEEHNRDDWMWGGISSAWFSKNLKYFQVPDAEEMGLEPL